MSKGIRVGEVLNESFQFGFHRWPTVFRLGWLPLLISGFVVFGLQHLIFDAEALKVAIESRESFKMIEVMRVSPFLAVGLTVIAVVFMVALVSGLLASIYRLVALGEERSGLVDLRFDGPAKRVFWAQTITTLINMFVLLLFVMAMIIMSGTSFAAVFRALGAFMVLIQASAMDPSLGQPDAATLEGLAAPLGPLFLGIFFAIIPILIINIRLTPFAPGSAAENRLLFFGSLQITNGHFLSLLGLYLLFGIALMLVGMIYSLVTSVLEQMASLGGAGMLSVVGFLFQGTLFALMVAYQVFVIGVQASLNAVVYRELGRDE